MSSAAAPAATRVAMDVTPLLGPRTGVGHMVHELAIRLGRRGDLDLTGVLVSWRGRSGLRSALPPGWAAKPLSLPARLAHRCWRRFDAPRLRGFDLIHGPNYVVPPSRSAAALVTVHDLTAWRYPDMVDDHARTYPLHLRRAVAAGAHIHTVSSFVAEELEDDLAIDADRIHVVANGFEPAPPGDPAVGRRLVGGPYILAIGTIEPRKDYVTLVRAVTAIADIHPDLRLVIVGRDGWGVERVDEAIADSGLGSRVHRMGYVTEETKADLLAGAELLAYPSRYEGFGLPVLEAMGAGIPVVATTVGAIPEVAGRAAALVAPADPSALAGAMLSVLEEADTRAELIAAGRRRAATFSWDDTTRSMVTLYRQVLADR